jgi:hypothetical protein
VTQLVRHGPSLSPVHTTISTEFSRSRITLAG